MPDYEEAQRRVKLILLFQYLEELILSVTHVSPSDYLAKHIRDEIASLRRGYPERLKDLRTLRARITEIERDTKVHFHMPNGRNVLTAIKVYKDEHLILIPLDPTGQIRKLTSPVKIYPPGVNKSIVKKSTPEPPSL